MALSYLICLSQINEIASAHTGDHTIDEYPDISGITTARVSFCFFILKKFKIK